jgi:hypothetical protein
MTSEGLFAEVWVPLMINRVIDLGINYFESAGAYAGSED